MGIINIQCLSKFGVYNTVLFIITILYLWCPGFIYLLVASLYSYTTSLLLHKLPALGNIILLFVFMSSAFYLCFYLYVFMFTLAVSYAWNFLPLYIQIATPSLPSSLSSNFLSPELHRPPYIKLQPLLPSQYYIFSLLCWFFFPLYISLSLYYEIYSFIMLIVCLSPNKLWTPRERCVSVLFTSASLTEGKHARNIFLMNKWMKMGNHPFWQLYLELLWFIDSFQKDSIICTPN